MGAEGCPAGVRGTGHKSRDGQGQGRAVRDWVRVKGQKPGSRARGQRSGVKGQRSKIMVGVKGQRSKGVRGQR